MTRRSFKEQIGFTLLETLVTLVIVALVAGLVSQGLFQLARVERLLQSREVSGPRLEQLYQRWLVDTLRGLVVTGPTPEDRFFGESQRLQGISSLAPTRMTRGLSQFTMSLAREGEETALWLEIKEIDSEPTRVRLMAWPEENLRWRFEDDAGRVHEQWPPREGLSGQALPRLIRLEQGDAGRLLLIAAPQNNYLPWVPIKEQEG